INREAAVEIARQLQLRDIGGIVVVDFIDMHTKAHQEEILELLGTVLAQDKMKPRVQDLTVLNLVEITRKKARQNLSTVLYSTCPTCQGSGRVQSPETISIEIKRRLRTFMSKRLAARKLLIQVHPLVANWLLQHEVKAMERELSCYITVEADAAMHVEAFAILDNTSVDK
ncbi:MAG: ribonuclease E/G, partial [Acidaminococcaceae bacterium]